MQQNGKKLIGGIACENCCNCHDHQLWKMFASCINFSWFFLVLLGESATIRMIAISDIKDWIKIDRTVGIDGMKKIKLMASMELIKLLELVVPMKMEKGVQYWYEWLNWGHGNYGTDGFNQINWSDGTNGTKCVRIDRAPGSVWFHWMKLSERMKCKNIFNW